MPHLFSTTADAERSLQSEQHLLQMHVHLQIPICFCVVQVVLTYFRMCSIRQRPPHAMRQMARNGRCAGGFSKMHAE